MTGSALSCLLVASLLAAGSAGSPPPPRPAFQYATELTAESFVELVVEAANGTSASHEIEPAQDYLPLVLFHVSWCGHCKHALPEFEEAARVVSEAAAAGKLANIPVHPRFFVIECDSGPEIQELCAVHTGTSFPAVRLFRDNRAIRFNRPRKSHVFAWWAVHASRPMVSNIERADQLAQAASESPAFVLKAHPGVHASIIKVWGEVALDFLEGYNFYVARPGSEAAGTLPGKEPVATVKGYDLDAFPLTGPFQKDEVVAWANRNRFPPVSVVTEWSVSDLLQCGIPVVTFVHSGKPEVMGELLAFQNVVATLRPVTPYVFATINMSVADTSRFVHDTFTLVEEPSIFIFKGQHQYWEDPTLTSPNMLTKERLQALLASDTAMYDNSWYSSFRERRTLLSRLATSSFLGAVIVVAVPSLMASCCWLTLRELLRKEVANEDDALDVKKED